MRFKIGVSGSSGKASKTALKKAFELGKQIALHKCVLVTGGCNGVPHSAVKGAKSVGGKAVGVSPAKNAAEHELKFCYPSKEFDKMVFIGKGKLERNLEFVRYCDAMVFVAGKIGTLNELTVAAIEGKPIGLLKGSGKIAGNAEKILKIAGIEAKIFSETASKKLVEKILTKLGK